MPALMKMYLLVLFPIFYFPNEVHDSTTNKTIRLDANFREPGNIGSDIHACAQIGMRDFANQKIMKFANVAAKI